MMNIKRIQVRRLEVIMATYSNVLYHLHLYLISKPQLTPLLDNAVKMTSKRRSFILLIFIIYKTLYVYLTSCDI